MRHRQSGNLASTLFTGILIFCAIIVLVSKALDLLSWEPSSPTQNETHFFSFLKGSTASAPD